MAVPVAAELPKLAAVAWVSASANRRILMSRPWPFEPPFGTVFLGVHDGAPAEAPPLPGLTAARAHEQAAQELCCYATFDGASACSCAQLVAAAWAPRDGPAFGAAGL
jgi:hypothetical protein